MEVKLSCWRAVTTERDRETDMRGTGDLPLLPQEQKAEGEARAGVM